MTVRAFTRHVVAEYDAWMQEFSYRSYVTESLRLATEGRRLKNSWADIVHPPEPKTSEDAREIVDELASAAGLEVRKRK